MAGNRQQFTLQFNADTSQAKKSIQELNNALQNLQKAQSNSGFADLGINKAVESAEELTKHLNKALNIDTGKLNLSAFQNSLQASNTSLKSLTNDLLKAGTVGQQAFLAMAGAIAQAEVPLRQTNKTIKDLAQTLKNTIKWEISSTAVHSLESALSGAVSYVKDLNSSLNNIRIVTGQSAEDMVKFAQQANRAARELSTTTKAYSDASLIYYQQGDSAEQAAKKAAITIKAANSSFNTSAAEMSEYLTAVWNSYQVGADELERYVDIMAALGAKTATSLEEIATSMQKVAATANTVGVSMEQVSSIISTVSSVTRESAESIGTSYKTIFARIGDLRLGESLDDGVTLGQVSSQLDKIGVKILDANGEMRDMGTIIEDLGSKWQTMSQAQKTAIAQVVAGKRQYTQLMALFENWDKYQNNMNIAKNAEGSLENMYKTQAESVEASSARMRAALENLYSKFINDTSIIKFTESITKVVDVISGLIDAFGGLPGILGNIGAIAIKVFSKDIAGGIDKTLAKLTTFTSQFTGKNTFTKVAKGVGATLTGRAQSVQQIEQQKAMTQARMAIEEQKSGVFNESGRFAVNEAAELLSYKEQLLSIQHQLTDAQKEEAQAALNNLSQQQAEIIKLKADKEQMQKDEVNALRKDKQAILREHSGTNALGVEHAFQSSTEKQKHINEQIKLQYTEGKSNNYYGNLTKADVSSIDAMLQKSKELGVQLEKTDQALEMIRGQLRSGDIQQTGAEFDALKGKIEQLLGKKLEANTLDDLRKELQQIGNEALSTQEQLEDLVRNTTDAIDEVGVGKKFSQALQNSFERGQESASLDFELNIKTSSLEKAKQKIKDALNPKSATYSKIAEGMTKAASATGSFIAGLSTGGNLLRTMTDEASSLGDKLNSVAGGVSTLLSGFATGGWIGLAISAIGMIISGISEAQKRAREMYKEDINTKAEEAQTKIDAIKDENASISQLLPKYGDLAGSITSSSQISSEYQTAVNDLTTALGFQGETIDGLIAKYHSLDQAIIEGTKTQIQESIDAYEQAKKDLVNKAAMDLAQNTEGIVQYGTSDSFYVDTSNLQSIINNQNTAQVYSGIGAGQFNYQGIMSNLITTYSGDFSEYLMSAMQQSFDEETGNFDFNEFYKSIFNQIGEFLEIDTDNFNDDEMNAYLDKANSLANFIQQFDRVFGDTKNNLGNYDFGNNSLLMLSELFAFGSSHGGESKGDFSKSWLGQLASGGNLNNLTERDQSEYWSDYVNIDTNLARETAIADSVEMSENAKATLAKMRSGATMTAEELYQFYLELTTLTEEYPELANDATYKALHAQFGTIFAGIQEPLEAAKTQLELIQNGMDITDLKSANIDSISTLRDYINEVYTKVTGLNTPAPASFMKSATDLLQLWGIIPEITNAFVNELSISAGIAENAGVSQDTVLTAMDKVRQDPIWQESTTPISYEDLNWNHLQFNKEDGTFNRESLLAEIAYAGTQDRKSKAATSIAGIKTLQGYNLSEIEALGTDGFEKLGIEFDDSITGFEGVKDVASWLKLSKEDRETYLTKLLEKQEEAYYAENGILQQAIDADTERKATLEEMYNNAITSKTYTDAKAAVATAEKQISAGDKIISQRDKITDADIMTYLKQLYGENFSEDLIQQYEIDAWRNAATDDEAKQTSFYQKVVSGQALASEGVVQEQAYLDTVAGYNAEAIALGSSIEQNSATKEWAEMIAEAGSSVDIFSNSIKVLTQDLSTLNNEFNALNSIDVNTVPKIGTQAYDALNTSLKKAGKTMSDYRQMSEKDRIKAIGQAKKENLEIQRAKQQEIEKQYADKYGFNASTTQADILATGDNYIIAAYDAWIASQNAQADLTDKIAQETQNTANELISVDAANTEAAIARFEQEQAKLQDAAEKMMEVSNILSSHIDGSELTFAERAKLDPVVLAQWDALTSNTERANFAAQQTAEAYQKQMEYQQKINDGIAMAENYMNSIGISSKRLLSNMKNFKNSEAFANWMDTTSMSDAAKSALKEADAIVRPTLGDKATYAQWGDAMRAQLKLMGDEGSSALALLEAKGKDAMSNIFSEFSKQMQAQAEAAVNAWIKAFNDISSAKQKLLSGGNLVEDIAGDPAKLIEYARAANMSVAEASQAIINGTITADKFTNPIFDINQHKATYGLDLTSYGGFSFGQEGLYYDQRAILKQNGKSVQEANEADLAETNTALVEKYTKILTDAQLENEDGTKWSTTQINDTVADILSGDEEAYKILTSASNDLTAAMQGSADALELYKIQQEALAGAQGKATEVLENGDTTATVNGRQGDKEELTKLDEALERAQAEKAKKDANWENLSAEDRAILASYGVTSFDEVDSAAAQCASALATLADVAYKAAEAFITSKEGGSYTQNEKGEWGTTDEEGNFQVDKKMTSYMESLNDLKDSANYHVSDVDKRTEDYEFSGLATKAGFDSVEELKEYTEYLKELGEINGETEKDNIRLAASYARIQNGLKSAQSNLKTYTKTLKEAQKGTVEHKKALDDMRKMYGDALDLDDAGVKALTEDFMLQDDVLKDLRDAAKGVDGAYDRLQEKAANHILDQLTGDADISSMTDELNALSTAVNSLPEGKALDWNELLGQGDIGQVVANNLNSLGEFLHGLGMTADQASGIMQALAAALGMDMEIEQKEFDVTHYSWKATPGGAIGYGENGQQVYIPLNVESIPETGTVSGWSIKTITNKGSYGGGIKSTPSKGGGGGKSKPKKLDKKKPEDEKERYHYLEQQLKRLNESFSEIDKLKDRTYGNKHLQNLEQEISLLKEQLDVQRDYIEAAKEYLAIDQQRVASLGATFDADGNITNYEEVMDSIISKYNEFIDRYNSASASQQEDMEEEKEEWDKWYEEKIEWISQYEETLATVNEKQNDLLEIQNKISEAMLAKIQYKVEVRVDINKDEQDLLDYLSEKYDEVIEKQGVIMNNLIRESELAQDNIRALEQSRYELELAFNSGNINQADYVEGLRDINEQLLDNLKTINDVKKDIEELYSDTIQNASEIIDKQTKKINNASEAMKSYISILQLLGKGQNYEDLMYFYEKQYDYNKASLQTQMDLLEVLKQEEKYYLDRIDSAQGLTETEREQYEALQETIQEVQNEILSSTESTLQSLQEKYNNTINSIMKNLEESIVGEGNSLTWLSEEYSYYLEEFNRYLSAQKQLYEISKLNRNIDKSIADTTEALYKKQLKQLQDEINARAENNSLSEYELNIMNLKYELLLKQIALEEAQNAKSTVRLTRDSEGNMIYQYTADADEISKAQQEYEDVLQQMVDANYEQVHNVEQQTVEAYQNMVDKIKEIATDETLTQEQKMERIQEIVAQTNDTLRYLMEQYNITSENLMYTNELVSERYNTALWEHSENAKNNMNVVIDEMIANTDKYVAEMQAACGNGGSIQSALEDYSTKVNEISELTSTKYGDMIDSVQNYDRVTKDAEDETRKMANELRNNLLPQIHTTTNAWDTYYKTLRTSITQTEALISKNNTLISSLAQITQAAQRAQSAIASVSSARVNTPYGSAGGSSSGGGSNSSSKSGASKSTSSDTTATDGKYYLTVNGNKVGNGVYSASEAAKMAALQKKYGNYQSTDVVSWAQFATGGLANYTGPAWLDGTKNKPELVLNPDDTQNMFRTIDAVRQLDKTTLNIMDDFINFATSSMMANMFNLHAGSTNGSNGELQQNVQITAEFPNVQDRNEIEAAFDNLINRASQFIGSKGRP